MSAVTESQGTTPREEEKEWILSVSMVNSLMYVVRVNAMEGEAEGIGGGGGGGQLNG